MLEVAERLEAWLQLAPDGPISLESGAARGVVKAFVDGWGSTMMRGLAARPMSLTELDRAIPDLSYPALERRLSSMRMAGLIEARPGPAAARPTRSPSGRAAGSLPLAAASRCERAHLRRERRAGDPRSTSRPPSCWRRRWSGSTSTPTAPVSSKSKATRDRSVSGRRAGRGRGRPGRLLRLRPATATSGAYATGTAARWFGGDRRRHSRRCCASAALASSPKRS